MESMFILSKVTKRGAVTMPTFALDFPDFAFVVEPEYQDMPIGGYVRLRVGTTWEQERSQLTEANRQAFFEKGYAEAN